MFAVTFLGHQGWMIRSAGASVLVDPLLREEFGDVHALEYRVYPPRQLRAEAFPEVDAVLLSHEHDDHFDIGSLARLDRRIPIYMSMHSSVAALTILREMGFAAHPLSPGIPLRIGDLDVIPFSGDHVNVNCADEWDALPYLIRDRGGNGSLFSMVDIALLSRHLEWAKHYAPRPGLVTWSNNALDWSHMTERPARAAGTEQCLIQMGTDHRMIATEWGKPAAMLMCAGGFSFHGERAWLNEHVFAVDVDAVRAKLASMYRDEQFFAALPGQTFTMDGQRLIRVDDGAPFLAAAPRAEWPSRRWRPVADTASAPDYLPASGRRDIGDDDAARLRIRMNELARALVGGILFRSLHSMLASEAPNRAPTFALVLRGGPNGGSQVFAYDASACAFVPGTAARPRETYVAGFECWASDLLAVLDGEMGPIALMFGRARMWNALPERLLFDLLEALTRVSHPLCCPDAYLRSYRRLWSKSRLVVPSIRAREGR